MSYIDLGFGNWLLLPATQDGINILLIKRVDKLERQSPGTPSPIPEGTVMPVEPEDSVIAFRNAAAVDNLIAELQNVRKNFQARRK